MGDLKSDIIQSLLCFFFIIVNNLVESASHLRLHLINFEIVRLRKQTLDQLLTINQIKNYITH